MKKKIILWTKTKLMLVFALILMNQNISAQIVTALTIKKGKQQLLFLGDYHTINEPINSLHFEAIINWLKKLSQKSIYIFEEKESNLKMLRDSQKLTKHRVRINHDLLPKILKKCCLAQNLTLNNVIFFPADVRNKLMKIYKIKISSYGSKELKKLSFLKADLQEVKNIIQILNFRKIRLTNEKSKKLLEDLFLELEMMIVRWEKEFSKINEATPNKITDLFWDAFNIIFVKFADLGFILAIFEAFEKDYDNIIVHIGTSHAFNIVNFLEKKMDFQKQILSKKVKTTMPSIINGKNIFDFKKYSNVEISKKELDNILNYAFNSRH